MKNVIIKVIQKVTFKTARVSVREDTVIYANGQQETHEIIEEPEGVLILPITQEGSIILTREYRHNHGLVYGVPMGRKELKDGGPLDSAKREFQEEVGLSAAKWTHISTHHNGIHTEGLNHYYIAEELSQDQSLLDADEDIEKTEMTFEDAFRLMDEGKIIDLRTMGCIWAGYIHLLHRGRSKT